MSSVALHVPSECSIVCKVPLSGASSVEAIVVSTDVGSRTPTPAADSATVELSFQFKRGDDAMDKLNTFFEIEDFPQYLRRSVSTAVWRALQTEIARLADTEADQLVAAQLTSMQASRPVKESSTSNAVIGSWMQAFRSTCDFRSESEALRSSEVGPNNTEPEADEDDETLPRRNATAVSASNAGAATASVNATAVEFDVAFMAVMAAGGEYVNSLFHVERENAISLGKALKRMEEKLQELQQRQSAEMDLVLKEADAGSSSVTSTVPSTDPEDDTAPRSVYDHQTPTDRISQLVNRHVADATALEESWRTKLAEIKKQQRGKYRQFVQSLYVNEVSQALPMLQHSNPMTVIYAQQKLKPQKGRSVSTLSARAPELDLITREMWMGSGQRKSSFTVKLSLGDVVDLCERDFSEKEFRQTKKCMQNLYSQTLAGVVLPHSSATWADIEGGVGASPRVKRFVRACERSTEYHFKTLSTQLRYVRMATEAHVTALVAPYSSQPAAVIRSAWGVSPFEDHNAFLLPGDSFITKHSNLLGTHVCFHLVDAPWKFSESDSLSFELGKNPVLDGVRQVIVTASRNGVHSLAIPVLFSESHRLSSLSLVQSARALTSGGSGSGAATSSLDQETSRLIEGLFRCVRTCMSELAADNESSLREVYFMVPPPTQVKSLASADQAASLDTPLIRQCKLAFNNVYQS